MIRDDKPFNLDDPATWPLKYPVIAHDVARSNDRSTAIVGGTIPYRPQVLGIKDTIELPQDCYGSALASHLAIIDRQYNSDALIIADLSNDPTYAEPLFDLFGPRLIGVHIGPMAMAAISNGGRCAIARSQSIRLAASICLTVCSTISPPGKSGLAME